ncbi:hypothetical protein EDEG_00620 [Edhazardia aedis USNM 41457]|uniref:60S ribosomal protein L8 n=1 Tax=Edhazardia aedis (strain USNM 41457) TaxID=1003232 RepID=J9DVK0_EDHAE|nr:hypothetical protein EDEG_00620 [Edhazardia aedis USNM 41457]|eukprot:EJW05317.1 hypothetical protein EDEG_00620 [Edhazardia aedis USNM 41457]
MKLRANLKKLTPEQKEVEKRQFEKKIAHKKLLLSQAIKIPPAIHQFATHLTESETSSLFKLLKKYKPENSKEKKIRLKAFVENGKKFTTPKPDILKFGIKHVVSLIESKKTKLVVIAADVDPIEVVIYLPTLCRKMDIPYCIVKSKKWLGSLVNLKQTAVVCLNNWKSADDAEFSDNISMMRQRYNDCYDVAMNTWGGGILLRKQPGYVDPLSHLQEVKAVRKK